MAKIPGNIIISRTDSIGDVVLTLPVASVLKRHFPGIIIAFMGRQYTRPVIEAFRDVDQFIDADDFLANDIQVNGKPPEAILHVFPSHAIASRAKALGIPLRIGTTNRWYHWTTCNQLVHLSRKNSDLHEAQLNVKLLRCFGIDTNISLQEIENSTGFEIIEPLEKDSELLVDATRYNLILHPKSQGSAREWPLSHYIDLIRSLDPSRYKIFISGVKKERALMGPLFEAVGHLVTDITGTMTLRQFIAFIGQCNGMLSCSTGPIHIAASVGIDAIGIYPPMRPIHPGRWRPLGKRVKVFVEDKTCSACRKFNGSCACIEYISPAMVKTYLESISVGYGG